MGELAIDLRTQSHQSQYCKGLHQLQMMVDDVRWSIANVLIHTIYSIGLDGPRCTRLQSSSLGNWYAELSLQQGLCVEVLGTQHLPAATSGPIQASCRPVRMFVALWRRCRSLLPVRRTLSDIRNTLLRRLKGNQMSWPVPQVCYSVPDGIWYQNEKQLRQSHKMCHDRCRPQFPHQASKRPAKQDPLGAIFNKARDGMVELGTEIKRQFVRGNAVTRAFSGSGKAPRRRIFRPGHWGDPSSSLLSLPLKSILREVHISIVSWH